MIEESNNRTLDEQLLDAQVAGLRARKKEGWRITRLDKAPTHLPGCDDYANRFVWYSIDEPVGPVGKQEYQNHGYVHFAEEIDL